MAIVLGANQYGKAETRVVRIRRDGDRHEIRDLNVTTDFRDVLSELVSNHLGNHQVSAVFPGYDADEKKYRGLVAL